MDEDSSLPFVGVHMDVLNVDSGLIPQDCMLDRLLDQVDRSLIQRTPNQLVNPAPKLWIGCALTGAGGEQNEEAFAYILIQFHHLQLTELPVKSWREAPSSS